jgi:3-deoxy-D-manno-octulosonate 8-phosphate phosphatase (KDO 8-P phosphatase)
VKKAQNIRMLLLDVDGVLTNGTIVYTAEGEEYKCFNTQDGLGIRLLLHEGIRVGLISGRDSKAVLRRAEDLGLTDVYQGIGDKVAVFNTLREKTHISPDAVCFIGDDLVDLPLLAQVGFAVAVANAVHEVKLHADYVTTNPGGNGAVREVCELILKSQGKWDHCLSRYLTL